jgi:leucyl-tRNA synthetase
VVDADTARNEAHVRDLVLDLPRIKQHVGDAPIRKFVFVPGKLANIVIG